MLAKKYRLRNYSAIIATYRNNNVFADKNVCIYLGREKTDKSFPTKFAFVVSKKVHKRAVIRNRIKRLMREAIRDIMKDNQYIYIHDYMSVVLVGKSSAIGLKCTEINDSIRKLLSR